MEQISSPHDKFFKEALSRQEAAVDFVVHYLPKDIASLLKEIGDVFNLLTFPRSGADNSGGDRDVLNFPT